MLVLLLTWMMSHHTSSNKIHSGHPPSVFLAGIIVATVFGSFSSLCRPAQIQLAPLQKNHTPVVWNEKRGVSTASAEAGSIDRSRTIRKAHTINNRARKGGAKPKRSSIVVGQEDRQKQASLLETIIYIGCMSLHTTNTNISFIHAFLIPV
jgi:hypothetical protein